MAKIFVKCKDKTSSRWLGTQSISIVGNIPQQVNATDEVRKLIQLGVLIETSAAEYERAHSKAKSSKEEKLKLAIELFNAALDSGDVKEAEKQAKNAKSNGLKAGDVTKFDKRIEALQSKLDAEKELEARTESAKVLVEEAIELEVLTSDDSEFICLGDKRLGKEPDQVINWAAKKDENLAEIQKAVEEKKADKSE